MLPSTRKSKGSQKYKKVRGTFADQEWGRDGQLTAQLGAYVSRN